MKVRKANKIMQVTENELDKYLSKGYVLIDEVPAKPQEPKSEEPKFAKVYNSEPKPQRKRRK